MREDLLVPILNHPQAPAFLERLQSELKEEAKKRHEFRQSIDDSVKAEFINGEIVMHSPVKRKHWKVSTLLSSLLHTFVTIKDLGTVGTEKVLISLTRNDYEPDICFFSKEKEEKFTDDQMIFPAPDFVVEILSKRTSKNDKGVKKQDYAEHGIQEYWIIDPTRESIEQHYLLNTYDKEYFMPITHRIDDDIESKVIKGFKIPVAAIFNKEINKNVLKGMIK